jgi:hypothetical protein
MRSLAAKAVKAEPMPMAPAAAKAKRRMVISISSVALARQERADCWLVAATIPDFAKFDVKIQEYELLFISDRVGSRTSRHQQRNAPHPGTRGRLLSP